MSRNELPNGDLRDALCVVGDMLDVAVCWYYRRAFHFRLPASGWTLVITPESAGRLRVAPCHLSRPFDTKWVHVADRARLASLVRDAEEVTTVGIC